jgi:mannose-6-phosphate isomerase-like protein (cupin superfamily)
VGTRTAARSALTPAHVASASWLILEPTPADGAFVLQARQRARSTRMRPIDPADVLTRGAAAPRPAQEYVRRGSPGAQPAYPGSPPEHIHDGQTETFEVLSGVFGYMLDGVAGTAAVGEAITVPPGAHARAQIATP